MDSSVVSSLDAGDAISPDDQDERIVVKPHVTAKKAQAINLPYAAV